MVATSEAGILLRMFKSAMNDLDPRAARAMLRLKFSQSDLKRVEKLVRLSRDGALSENQKQELDRYLTVNNLLILIHSKARRSLKKAARPSDN
jgi:hypothetical protein